jgi:trans-aconitate methyltransferase
MYKWDAQQYHKSSAEQQKWAQELLLKLKLKGTERVLDIGCGDGKITAEIARSLPNGSVLGIDSSEEMVLFARKNFNVREFPNLAFEIIDVRNLSFNAEFDVVFSNACLHWVVDHLPVLEGINRSLKPGGKALLQMGGKGNAAEIFEVLQSMLATDKWGKYFINFSFPYGFYGLEEYKSWLKQVNLKVKRVELIPKDMIHRGKKGLSGWVRTTWLPYIQKTPEKLREEFINELTDRYIKSHPLDKDGFVHIKMMRLEIEVEKR